MTFNQKILRSWMKSYFFIFYWLTIKTDIKNFTKVRIDWLFDHTFNDTILSSQPIVTKYNALNYKYCNSTSYL